MDSCFTISLFRHGLTVGNENHQYIGWTDLPLNTAGRNQVQEVSNNISKTNVERVFSSDLKRCTESAELLFPTYTIHATSQLREMHFGDWEGKTFADVKNYPDYQKWLESPFTTGPDKGETYSDFSKRIQKALQAIRSEMISKPLQHVAIITHGGVIRLLLTEYVKSQKSFFDWKIPYGKGYVLKWLSIDSFRREEACISLQVVPTTEKQHG